VLHTPATNGQQAEALDRLTRLQALTAALSQAVTSEQVADAIISQGMAVLGANAGCVTLLGDDRQELVLLRIAGAVPAVAVKWDRFPVTAPVPLAEAVRERAVVVLETFAERFSRYPALEGVVSPDRNGAMVALPLVVRGDVLGSLGWGWPADRPFSEEDRAFLMTLAGLCGQALDRARLYDSERAARQRVERAEDALRVSEQRHRLLSELTSDFAYGLRFLGDGTARMEWVSEGFTKFSGYSLEELNRQGGWPTLVHPDDLALASAAVGRLREGRRDEAELRLVTKAGEARWVRYLNVPVRDESGRVTGFVGAAQDIHPRKQAEFALRESEARFRGVVECNMIGVGFWDAGGRLTDPNDAFLRMTGYTREEFASGRVRYQELTPPEYAPLDEKALAQTMATGRCEPYEKEYVRKDGSRVPVLIGGGCFEGCRDRGPFFALDISALKRVEQALRESEGRLRAIIDNSPSAIFVKDPAGRYLLANKACEAYSREPVGRVVGKTAHDYFPRELADHLGADDRKVLETGEPLRYESVMPAQGGTLTALTVKFPLRDAGGRPYAVCGIATDITELKRATEALRASEERFARFMQHLPGLAWVKDEQGRYVYANDAALNAFGKTRAEVCGKTDEEVFPPATAAQFRENDRKALASVAGVRVVETLEQADGVLHHSVVSKFPIPGPEGAAALVGGMAIDITEEVRTRAVLEESEERLRTLSNNLPHGAIYQGVIDRQGRRRCTYISSGVERLFGVTPAEVLADATVLYNLIHEEDQARVAAQDEAASRTLAPLDCEFRSRTRSGSLIWVHTRSASRRLANGETVWEGIILDVTARKRAEEESRLSRDRLDLVVNSVDVGLWYCDLPFDKLIWNAKVKEHFGLAADADVTIGTFYERLHPDDRGRTRQAIERSIRDRTPYDIEYRTVGLGGRERWVRAIGRTFYAPSGQPVKFDGITVDVTERVRAERTIGSLLRISERLNSSLDVDALLDALVQEAIRLVDAESGVAGLHTAEGMVCKRYFQKGAALPLDYRWPPMHGLPGWLIVHKVPYLTNDALADTQIVHELCVRFGVRSALSTPILNASGEVLGFFEVHNKRAAEGFGPTDREMLLAVSQTAAIAIQNALAYRGLQLAEESLKDADRRKDDFLATLAHELRNPLAPLRNGLQVMKLAAGNAGAVEQARSMMERQMAVMVRLIDDLLDVSRITRGKLELRKERVELASVVQSAVEGSRPLIEASGHRLTIALPEPIPLDADPTRLAQVFSNLLTNAAKYTDRGGQITLTAKRDGGGVVVSVRDTGIGIAPEHLPRLFEMFSQVTTALERSQGGLGIGLSLVKGLVEMHGGTVEARSEGLGKGSEFIVQLPVAGGRSAPESPQAGGGDRAKARGSRRILVADDNRDAAESLAMMLRLAGHEVHAAHDGRDAVEAAAWFRPDVALLDIGMPKLNGFEVARRVREQPWGRNVVLVAITGWGQEEDKRRATEAGFDCHLTKPVEPAALEKLLGTPHL
jgi:PAS domain S-box-containing protein